MSNEQRITEAESNQAWLIFSDREKYLSLSDEQSTMVDAFVYASKIKQETGEWPTLAQVKAKWMQEAAERERKRLESWQPNYRFTQKDLAEYEESRASEEFSPFMDFMRAVAHIKESTGSFPTVAEVRVHCAANQKV